MNPFMSEQLARAKAADWERAAEQRRLSNLATRDPLGKRPPTFRMPRIAGRLASWADQMRTILQALTSGAVRAATGTPEEEVGSGPRTHTHSKSF